MADWAKIRFYWKTMFGAAGSTLSASSTFAGTSVESIANTLETDRWQAAQGQGPHYITFDAGEGRSHQADYLGVCGHNLSTAGALVALEHSSDGLSYTEAFTPFVPASDKAFVKEFSGALAHRFWRIRLEGTSVAPFIYVAACGEKTELDYASASFDPHEQEGKGSTNLSYGGYLAGVHSRFIERTFVLRFDDADPALYAKVKEWWEGCGSRNFLVAWEASNHADDVFLMRPDARFANPLKSGGAARDIVIPLAGRKE